MKYASLGTTGVSVSRYCLGAMMFGQMGNKTITHLSNLKAKVVYVGRVCGVCRVEWSGNSMLFSPLM